MITVRNLIQQYRSHQPGGRFFDRDILENYGESINRMKVSGKGVIQTRDGSDHICYELQAVQKLPFYDERIKRYYFDENDFSVITPGNA